MDKEKMLKAFEITAEMCEDAWQKNDMARKYDAGGHPRLARQYLRLSNHTFSSYCSRKNLIIELGLEDDWTEFCKNRYKEE